MPSWPLTRSLALVSGSIVASCQNRTRAGPHPPCDIPVAKRGLALYGDNIFTVASDNVVIALDARTGKLVWEVSRGTRRLRGQHQRPDRCQRHSDRRGQLPERAFRLLCHRPRHHDRRGVVAQRGHPRPGKPGDETWGGTSFESRWCTGVWGQIVYDPVQNLVQYGSTGICPASDFQRGVAGKNATLAGTNERWAVRPETGEVVWRRQLLPQDNWDQECTFEMMLIDTPMRPNPNAEGMLAANPTDRHATTCVRSSACPARTPCSGRSMRKPASSSTPEKPSAGRRTFTTRSIR